MKRYLIISFLMFFSLITFGQNETIINLNEGKAGYKILNQNNQGFELYLSCNEIKFTSIKNDKGDFVLPEIEGFVKSFDEGKPSIPTFIKLIEIPQGSNVKFNIVSYEEEIINLSDYKINYPIIPAKRSQSKSEDEVPISVNEKIYENDAYYTKEIVSFSESGMLRSSKLGEIEISLISYNPIQNKLKVFNNLLIEVVFENSDILKTENLKKKYASPYFDNISKNLVINELNLNSTKELITESETHYVIVSDRMFEAQLVPFVEWKIKKGFDVTIGYTDIIGTTTTEIKTWLQSIYEGSDPMSFVLFVGDVDQIPAWSAGGHVTDLRYCEYTGDNIPEVYYGRFSAQNTSQLQPQIDKTLLYEKYQMSDPTYLENNLLVAGVDGTYAITHGNGTINYGTDYYFNAEHDINPLTYLYNDEANSTVMASNNSNASSSIIGHMSSGVGFANYTAHCGPSGWSNPGFSTTSISNLTNSEKYGLWIGNCCESVRFEQSECFGEAALRKVDGGAIGDIGGSNSTYWDEDYWWGVGLKGGSVTSNPTYEETGLGTYDGVFHDKTNEINDLNSWFTAQGQINMVGNLAVQASSSSLKQYYWEIYHLMGDPSLMPYMRIPDVMNITTSPTELMFGMTSLDVSSAPYTLVALSQSNVLIDAVVSDENGNATLVFPTDALSVGDADLVVTGQNKIPYINTITVTPADEPYIILESFTTNISPDFGQSVELNVTLKNVAAAGSGYDATNVVATLTLTDGYVTISDGIENYGTIIAGETSNINAAFSVDIANNVPDQYIFNFALIITGNNAIYTWPGTLNLTANAPVITIGDYFITNDGNSDGTLDPGETGDINFSVNNNGHAGADFSGILSESNDPNNYLTLATTNITNISIPSGSSYDFSFSGASTNISTPLESIVEIQIDISAGAEDQYAGSDNQDLNIGVMPVFPISDEGTNNVCLGYFYDSGSDAGNYRDNENFTMTFLPSDGNEFIVIDFLSFSTEANYDYLRIYNGPDTSYPLIGIFDGTNSPGVVKGANGLTFRFTSDGSANRTGWIAEISCYTPTTVPECSLNPVPANSTGSVYPSTLSWDEVSDASYYEVYFGTDPDPFSNTPTNVLFIEYDVLVNPYTTYYWAVIPSNSIGTPTGCDIWSFDTGAEQYLMTNATIETCDAIFYDDGGENSNYSHNVDYTMTFIPNTVGQMIQVEFFDEFQIESCTYDRLTIYNGTNTSAPILNQFCGTTEPTEPIPAFNADGALTFVFHSDGSINYNGWSANISCVDPPPNYTITFNVTDGNNPMEGVTVDFNGESTLTDALGNAIFDLVLEEIGLSYTISIDGYYDVMGSVDADSDKTVDISMDLIPIYTISFNVTDGTNAIEGATVSFKGENIYTDATGIALFDNIEEGTDLTYIVTMNDYYDTTGFIDADMDKTVDITLDLIPTYTITFSVNDGTTVLEGATVNFNSENVDTDVSGIAVFNNVKEGAGLSYVVTMSDFYDAAGSIDADIDKTVDITLDLIPTYTITFSVTDVTNILEGATVNFNSENVDTDASGIAVFDNLKEEMGVTCSINMEGYDTHNGVVDINGTKTIDVVLTKTVSISSLERNFRIYPNPSDGIITLDFGKLNDIDGVIEFFSLTGKIIYQSKITSNKFLIDLSDQSKGLYFMKIFSNGKSYNYKVIFK